MPEGFIFNRGHYLHRSIMHRNIMIDMVMATLSTPDDKASAPAGRSPKGRGGRASALLPLPDDVPASSASRRRFPRSANSFR
jgi:hypothetical protein